MRRSIARTTLVLVLTLVAASAAVLRAQDAAELVRDLDAVRASAADRDLAAVETRARELLAAGPGADAADETRLLLGRTRLAMGRLDEALAAVDPVVERPESIWHVKALYLVAEASARKRNWKRAADVYAARVDEAASDAHAARTAALYREIADGAYEGEERRDAYDRVTRVRDWVSARRYYEKARGVFVPEADRALVTYRIGLSALESGDPAAAVRELTALLGGAAGEFADDALYALGRARLAGGDRRGARAAFDELRERFGDSELAPPALVRIGESRLTDTSQESARRAVAPWREFLRLYPSHDEAAAVLLRVGETWAAAGRPDEASAAFLEFVAKHPGGEQAPAAQDRAAAARLALGDFDGAVAEWRVLLERWPDHPLWAPAQRRIAEASFLKGRKALEDGRDGVARDALTAFLAAFPVDDHAPQAQRLLGDLASRAGDHVAAVAAWRLCATKYPQSAAAPAAMLQVAAAYEGPLGDLAAALAAYEQIVQRWPASAGAQQARSVLVQMKGKTLTAHVARAFRTDEEPTVRLDLRNVPKLALKAYRLDAADFTRRRGGLSGIEGVDVDVVRPDHAWDWEPADYERYRLLRRDCPLPFDAPGAYIVTAADDELTARFLVVISDLTTIVKSSQHGGLVFVYDERTGQPVRGARVHVLDGDRHGVTGADGVWRDDVEGQPRLRALVTGDGAHEGHFAFADASAGAAASFGYTTKVFLQTDRPLYRDGQTVQLRAIVRRVTDGRYVASEGLSVPVRVSDPRGATLFDEKLATDAYGVIAATLDVVAEPTLGTYTVSAQLDGRTFTRTFEVRAFRKPDMLVDVAPGRAAYLSGDTVKATISLRYAVGGVASAAPVRWAVQRGPYAFDASVHDDFAWFFRDPQREQEERRRAAAGTTIHARGEAVTDSDGRVTIEFVTDAVEEDRVYTLIVEAQDPSRRWVSAAAAVPVTERGFYVMCKTEKKVVRPGEEFALETTVVNALHVPVQVEGRAVLVRRVRVDQHFVEEDVLSVPASTDERGRASVALTAPRAGTYLARFVAADTRGRDIVGAAEITVSGDTEDLSRHAKLVADREFYREGDVAKVLVNVPSAPVPVLLTYEGGRVLEHRVYMAQERSSTVAFPLSARDAPNVFLRMAVAKDGELQEAGDEVAVFQYLDVSVQADRDVYGPGDDVTLTLRTTDQSGNPVRARVGIDVVDAALYELEPDGTPQIKPFFYDQRRTHSVSTASSAALALPSVTRPTNRDLLFERMRRLGKARFEEMQEHVRRGRKLLEQGQREQAVMELEKALEIAPGNYEARGLLDEVAARDKVMRETRRLASKKSRPGARKAGDVPARAPAEEADRDAGAIGLGGGAGGSFGGRRGGRRNLRAGGGGGRAKDALRKMQDAEVGFFTDDADGDFRARTENSFRRLAEWASKDLQGAVMLAQGAAPFVVPELRQRFEDTAFSDARVETGDDGNAEITFTLPDNLTEWRVTARGASTGALVGDTRSSFAVTKPLLVRADAPRFLVDGDASTATAVVHSSLDEAVPGVVTITSSGPAVTGDARYELDIAPGSVTAHDAALAASARGVARVRVSVATRTSGDAAETALPVLPRGLRRLDGASGTLVEEAFIELQAAADAVDGTTSLVVTLSPAIDVSLIESLAYTSSYPYGCVEQIVNRFLPALAARNALRDLDSPAFRRRERLDDAVRRGLAALYALQRPDGSFGWFAERLRGGAGGAGAGGGDAEMTAYGLLGYLRAEQAGFAVSVSNRDAAIAASRQLLRGAAAEDRAFLLYALSFAGKAQLADLNALHRERAGLSPRALALLALAMDATGRPTNALELVQRLSSLAVADGGAHWDGAHDDEKRRLLGAPARFADAEPTAYALLALLTVEPSSPLIDGAAEWLAASRRGPAWRSTRDTAAAIEGLAAYAALRGVERASGTVSVYVNDAEPLTVDFGAPGGRPADAPVSLVIPAELLHAGANTIALRRSAPGRVHFSALLASVTPPPAGAVIEAGGTLLAIKRDYTEWVAPPLPGEAAQRRVAPGYDVVVPEKRPAGWIGRPLARAGVGDKVRVTLRVSSRVALERVIVEDALPAGFEVVPDSASGPFDRQERRDDRQAFFLSKLHRGVTLSYVLQAVHPGSYAALPAQARAMYEPEIRGWSRENRLDVVRESGVAGAGPSAEEITPDEIWGLARRDAERANGEHTDWGAVRDALRGLLRDYTLRPEIALEAWVLLFRAGIESNDAALIVKAYEEIVDRGPRRAPTGLGDRERLASAYRGLGEHERALAVLRDLVRERYATDRAAAEAFTAIGNPWRTRELLLGDFRELPDTGWLEAQEWALAQRTAAMNVTGTGPGGPLMLTEAVAQLRAFEAHHATSKLAHEAGHLAVQLLLRMGLSEDVIEEGQRFLARHEGSKYLDDVTYLVAEGQFRANAFDQALAAARPLLEKEFPTDADPRKRVVSPFRAKAIHLTARIAHARGQLSRAVDLYRQVAHLFPDARDAYAFLTAKGLKLREVESVAVGETPELHLRRRNAADVRLRVFAVDFMILYALRPDLSQVNRIDLSGIRPVEEWTVARRGGEDHRWSDEVVPLPVTDKGVYLVVARAGDLEASSVVLVSDVQIDVQVVGGAVRVYATDRATGAPLPEVYVKIGDGKSVKAQGFTDARGVFEAPGVGGSFSVVAEKNGDVALWRK